MEDELPCAVLVLLAGEDDRHDFRGFGPRSLMARQAAERRAEGRRDLSHVDARDELIHLRVLHQTAQIGDSRVDLAGNDLLLGGGQRGVDPVAVALGRSRRDQAESLVVAGGAADAAGEGLRGRLNQVQAHQGGFPGTLRNRSRHRGGSLDARLNPRAKAT